MGSETITYPLEVDEALWEQWKDTVPRSKNLDEALTEMLEEQVENQTETDNHE